ncbi:unnamed protein product [Caenorhabditis bovis]|uniref:Rho GDP-dissociation inhibitor n=1 Tax=Caenorhabditis bovis TaxID=2654633 RepID=A0A8S1EQE1_9PELO|nr:unnamed protein product [Caenorhabditis bovis]
MSDNEAVVENGIGYEYKKPPETSINELLNKDTNDESLKVYKEKLLGQGNVVIDPNDPRRVLVRSVELMIEGKDPVVLDLSDPTKLKTSEMSLTIKEGSNYRLKFSFHVQREIASGLHYKHKIKRSAVTVGTETYMMGSFAPKTEIQESLSPMEEAPSGMLHRGKYKVHSEITDDDNNVYLDWKWTLHITKD